MLANFLKSLVFCLVLGLMGCSDRAAETTDDTGYVTLDGGGPLASGDGAGPVLQKDSAGSKQAGKGKFCHGIIVNGQKISLVMKIGPVSLSAVSGVCSKCLSIPAGSQPMSLYSGGNKIGAGTVGVQPGKESIAGPVHFAQ